MSARRRHAGAIARGAALVLLSVLTAAGARADEPMQITFVPSVPTWHDDVQVTVSGDRLTACDSSAFQIVPVVPFPGTFGPGPLFYGLVESCPVLAPATLHHIVVSRDLGQLSAGDHTFWLSDQSDPLLLTNQALTVYQPGGGAIELPPLVTDTQAAPVRVSFMGLNFGNLSVTTTVSGRQVLVHATVSPFPIDPLPPPAPAAYAIDYTLPLLAAGDYELLLVDDSGLVRMPLRVWAHDGCLPSASALCLDSGRFRVTATWRAFDGSTGAAHALPIAGNDGSGLLSFFAPQNAEITIKVLDGCALDHAWWVFLASGSTVAYSVTVEDMHTGERRVYDNPLGRLPPLVADTGAFGGCG